MRVRRRAAASLVVAALGTGCTPGGSPAPQPTASAPVVDSSATADPAVAGDGGTLRYALDGNPASIDPRFVADTEGVAVVDALFDSLVAMRPDLRGVEPAAAASWDVSDDGLVYTFTLRDDGRFHDGRPVTADDFVRTFRRIVDRTAEPASFLFYQLAAVEGYAEALANGTPLAGVEALDPRTLQIRLSRPTADLLEVLTHPSLAPVPASADQDLTDYGMQPIGNGPFAMAEPWQPNQFIRVVASDGHPDEPGLDEVVFQIYADDPSREQQFGDFERGQLDVAGVPPRRRDEVAVTYGRSEDGRTGPGLLTATTGALYHLGFTTTLPPFDDPAVRRAVSMLVDRDRIVETITLGARQRATSIVPPSLAGQRPSTCDHCRYDPEAALAELRPTDPAAPATPSTEATTPTEGGDGSEAVAGVLDLEGPIRVLHNEGSVNARVAQRVAADIRRGLGVDVVVEAAELEPYVTRVRAGEVHVFRLGWQADYPSPGAVLQPLFRTDAIGADNLTRFSDPEVDALLDAARAEPDVDARLGLYADAEARILELAPVAPLFFYPHDRVVARSVEGLRISPIGTLDLAEVRKQDQG